MIWIIIIVVAIFIIYRINKNYKESVNTHVAAYGGMRGKYDLLVQYFTQSPGARISKLTRDNITVSSSSMTVYIDNVAGDTEIRIKAYMPIVGNISKRWVYPPQYPQEKIIQEIESYLEWEISKLK